MNIFLIEDNIDLNKNIATTLKLLGHTVSTYTDGKIALKNISQQQDLYIIDIMIPNINGLLLLKKIKEVCKDTPCFIMSGDTKTETITSAYEIGADDFLKKPFDLEELEAKIRKMAKSKDNIVCLSENCKYDLTKQILYRDGKPVDFTRKESRLLNILIKSIGHTVATKDIETYVWGPGYTKGHTRQLVSKIRKKLPCDIIKNHAGNGYKIEKCNKMNLQS